MACDPLNYSGVDSSKWDCAKEVVQSEYGMAIGSDQGEMTERGFTLKWSYDPSAQTLQIQCTKKPFVVPCGMVNSRIEDAAAKCGITATAES
jgi:hypothetical protein